ncbi:hypothetical protein G6O67_003778 [Ophiocordyceps sinensis]|uniref:Uncharacterized protein n=1 Tax=Ophiocordyceps sinensis TaxID=72228 RepID=A0A8H4V6D0_9HYPO|nr:hypothetical protein G6O67_003778 [Ophiocordyceps sinensis]
MFDLPDAKRVRREDITEALGTGWLDNSDDEGIKEELHARIGQALGLNLDVFSPPSPPPKETGAEESQDEDLGEFEFRLFSTAGSKAKVVLQSEKEGQGEGGIVARRSSSHYLVPRLPAELRRQYEFAAVSGEDVLARSRQRTWGLELPWKVTRITTTTTSPKARPTVEAGAAADCTESAGRKRPGKKTRIALRKGDRARKQGEEKEAEKLLEKEERIKDKKKRLNRAKKLRQRAKDKEKKTAANGGGGEERSDSDGSG